MKFVHTADLHLDSPLRGLSQYEGAPIEEVRSATRKTLSALVDLCLEERVQLLVIAGDLYDGDFKDYSTALFFSAQMARLREGDTQVVWLRGNHDAANRLTRHLRTSEHVHELSHESPSTHVFEQWGVAVHGQGYASRDGRENLALGYPEPLSGMCNLGVLHTALDGREGHAPYAPCTAKDLRSRGYDYWALGHVHQREVIHQDPWIVFPGNPQGRHVKETGPKGCTLVQVTDTQIEWVKECVLDQVRWEICIVDLSDARHVDDVVECATAELRKLRRAAGHRVLATRVRLVGKSPAHALVSLHRERIEAELCARSLDVGDIYLERIEHLTQPEMSREVLQDRRDALGDLFRSFSSLSEDVEAEQELWDALLRPLGGVSAELLRDEDIDAGQIVAEARRLLEARLLCDQDVDGEK